MACASVRLPERCWTYDYKTSFLKNPSPNVLPKHVSCKHLVGPEIVKRNGIHCWDSCKDVGMAWCDTTLAEGAAASLRIEIQVLPTLWWKGFSDSSCDGQRVRRSAPKKMDFPVGFALADKIALCIQSNLDKSNPEGRTSNRELLTVTNIPGLCCSFWLHNPLSWNRHDIGARVDRNGIRIGSVEAKLAMLLFLWILKFASWVPFLSIVSVRLFNYS